MKNLTANNRTMRTINFNNDYAFYDVDLSMSTRNGMGDVIDVYADIAMGDGEFYVRVLQPDTMNPEFRAWDEYGKRVDFIFDDQNEKEDFAMRFASELEAREEEDKLNN